MISFDPSIGSVELTVRCDGYFRSSFHWPAKLWVDLGVVIIKGGDEARTSKSQPRAEDLDFHDRTSLDLEIFTSMSLQSPRSRTLASWSRLFLLYSSSA
jgi:hypothetical protein